MKNIEGFNRKNLLKNSLANSRLIMDDLKGINIAYGICENVIIVKLVIGKCYWYEMSACHRSEEFNLSKGINLAFKRAFEKMEKEMISHVEIMLLIENEGGLSQNE